MDEMGIESIRRLEDMADLPRDTVRRLIAGRTKSINREKLAALARTLKMTIEELITHPEDIEFLRVPLFMHKLQKVDRTNDEGLTIEKYVAFPKELMKYLPDRSNADLALIPIVGEGISPDITTGDLAILDVSDKKLTENNIYAICMAGSIVPRKMSVDGDNIVLESDGSSGPPFIVKRKYVSQLRIIGRIIGRIGAV